MRLIAFSILFLFGFTDKNALTSLATSTNGDIRAAINAFQIGCATQNYRKKVFEGSTSLQSSKKKAKNSNSSSKNTKGSTLAVIGGKNNKMDLFHAIGRICERISCEESAIFFANIAKIPHIRQNHLTFPPTLTKNNLKKIISA